MKQVKVLSNQTFLDLSIQYTGNVFNAFAIALHNGLSITDDLINGSTIEIPDGLTMSAKELQYYAAREILPATGITKQLQEEDYSFPGEFPFSF